MDISFQIVNGKELLNPRTDIEKEKLKRVHIFLSYNLYYSISNLVSFCYGIVKISNVFTETKKLETSLSNQRGKSRFYRIGNI